MRSVFSIKFRWFFSKKCKFIRRELDSMRLSELFRILTDKKYKIHLAVYLDEDGSKTRVRVGQISNLKDFKSFWEGESLVENGINSEDVNIRGAKYIDSYVERPLYNECNRYRKLQRVRKRRSVLCSNFL